MFTDAHHEARAQKARRQSYKTFTRNLLAEPDLLPPPAELDEQPFVDARPAQIADPPHRAHLPTASLILGETTTVLPRLPRPSKFTLPAMPTAPLSYAYGAPSTGKERASHTRPPRNSITGSNSANPDTESVGGRSRGSRYSTRKAGGPDVPDDDGSMSLDASSKNASEPAAVRYARLKQRVENTGSATVPPLSPPKRSTAPKQVLPEQALPPHPGNQSLVQAPMTKNPPKPTAASLKGTSVQIASAFEQARWAASAEADARLLREAEAEMRAQLRQIPDVEDEEDSIKETHIEAGDPTKKRKKGRKSQDTTYRYKPGDTSDSSAGEGLAPGRDKREVKVTGQENEEANAGEVRVKKRARVSNGKAKARRGPQSDTDSQDDTGPGIASSRGRRNLATGEQNTESIVAVPRKSGGRQRHKQVDGDYVDHGSDSDATVDGDTSTRKTKLRAPRVSIQNAAVTETKPLDDEESVDEVPKSTYFMTTSNGLSSSLSPMQPHQRSDASSLIIPGQRNDMTVSSSEFETGHNSRNSTYNYEDEENLVRALQAEQNLQRSPRHVEPDSPPQHPVDGTAKARARQAASRVQFAQQLQDMHRLPNRDTSVISNGTPVETLKQSFGIKVGRTVRRAFGSLGKIRLWQWLALFALLLALLTAWAGTPWSKSMYHQAPYAAPDLPPKDAEELIARLTFLEKTVSTLSHTSAQAQEALSADHARLGQVTEKLSDISAHVSFAAKTSQKELDKLSRSLSDEITSAESQLKHTRSSMDSSIQNVQKQVEDLAKQLKAASNERRSDGKTISSLTSTLSQVEQNVASLGKQVVDIARATNDESLEAAAMKAIENVLPSKLAVRVDSHTGKVEVDPAFWRHLKSAFEERGQGSEKSVVVQQPTWDDFLASNGAALKAYFDTDYSSKVKSGAVVSKKAFLDILKREVNSMQLEMERVMNEQTSKLGTEISDKLTKHQQSSSRSSQPAHRTGSWGQNIGTGVSITIKATDGRNVTDLIGSLVDVALHRYSKDVIAKKDFALFNSGARVIPQLTGKTWETTSPRLAGRVLAWVINDRSLMGRPPATALHHDISVGSCWPFPGSLGQLGIQLSRPIIPTDVTVEHASPDVALDVSSAPKEWELWGLLRSPDDAARWAEYQAEVEAHKPTVEDESVFEVSKGATTSPHEVLIGHGTYVPSSSHHIQTVPVTQAIKDVGLVFDVVMFRVRSNHGNPDYTCLYRVRVHGEAQTDEAATS